MYLLASDFLIRHGKEVEDLDEAERERLTFHLRQFVDAMSPTLLLVSNPVALRRAMETGGASLADGAHNLLHDLREGRLSMVDATAFEPGRNLAMTPGKVVLRNRLIELIQYAPTTEKVQSGADPDHAAVDQQVLHPGHAAQEQHGEVSGRPGLHGVHGDAGRTPTPRWRTSPSRTT